MKCSAPIVSPMKVGSCPSGFYDKPAPGMGWISGMCFYAKSIGKFVTGGVMISVSFFIGGHRSKISQEIAMYLRLEVIALMRLN